MSFPHTMEARGDMAWSTADLTDEWGDAVSVVELAWRDFGARLSFQGPAATLKVFEDNTLVRGMLEDPGQGRVWVDGGGSTRCAVVGDKLADRDGVVVKPG